MTASKTILYFLQGEFNSSIMFLAAGVGLCCRLPWHKVADRFEGVIGKQNILKV